MNDLDILEVKELQERQQEQELIAALNKKLQQIELQMAEIEAEDKLSQQARGRAAKDYYTVIKILLVAEFAAGALTSFIILQLL